MKSYFRIADVLDDGSGVVYLEDMETWKPLLLESRAEAEDVLAKYVVHLKLCNAELGRPSKSFNNYVVVECPTVNGIPINDDPLDDEPHAGGGLQ